KRVGGSEARVDALEKNETPNEQACAEQQYQRKRDFGDHQRAANTMMAPGGSSSTFLQSFVRARPRRLDCRRKPENDSRRHSHEQGEPDNSYIEIHVIQPREILRRKSEQ